MRSRYVRRDSMRERRGFPDGNGAYVATIDGGTKPSSMSDSSGYQLW